MVLSFIQCFREKNPASQSAMADKSNFFGGKKQSTEAHIINHYRKSGGLNDSGNNKIGASNHIVNSQLLMLNGVGDKVRMSYTGMVNMAFNQFTGCTRPMTHTLNANH